MSDEAGELIGTLFVGLLVLVGIVAIFVFIIVPILLISMGIGALFGGGNAVYNYGKAFRKNVKPERIS